MKQNYNQPPVQYPHDFGHNFFINSELSRQYWALVTFVHSSLLSSQTGIKTSHKKH